MWESRVLQRAFERLELHEGKLSRAVLRGGGGGDVTSLPDLWGVTPRATRPCSVRFNRATSLKEAARAGWWMLTQILVKPPRIMERQRLKIVLFFHGLAFQDQGSPLPDHLGHLETVQGLSGKRHQQVTLRIGAILG